MLLLFLYSKITSCFVFAGKMSPKVDTKNGRILFVFTGDDCTPKTKYTVNIVMKCDYEAGNNSHPELFHHVCIH